MAHEKWKVLTRESKFKHPSITVDFEEVQLPDGRIIPEWPIARVHDYVNAFVVNELGEVLVLEGYKHGLGRSSWQMLGGALESGEDPLKAIDRLLLEETGYTATSWRHLGSFVTDPIQHMGVGHFFLARQAKKIAEPISHNANLFELKWVRFCDLKRALWDGRIAGTSYAVTVSLGMMAVGC